MGQQESCPALAQLALLLPDVLLRLWPSFQHRGPAQGPSLLWPSCALPVQPPAGSSLLQCQVQAWLGEHCVSATLWRVALTLSLQLPPGHHQLYSKGQYQQISVVWCARQDDTGETSLV